MYNPITKSNKTHNFLLIASINSPISQDYHPLQTYLAISLYYQKSRMEDPIADFLEWYKTRPLVTKTFLTLSTLLSVVVTMDYISIYQVFYTFSETYQTLELWRPLTSLLYLGNLNFTFVIEAYFAYQALISAETGIFQRQQMGSFWYLLIYLFCMMTLFASFIDLYFITDGFLFGLLYIWCKVKPFNRVTLIFGIDMQSGYFPWVYLGLTVLLGQSFINMVGGFLIAHLYLYIKGPLQEKIGIDLLKTPSILNSLANLYNKRAQRQQAEQRTEEDDMYQ